MAKVSVLQHLLTLLNERDIRYQQRFEAQEAAIEAARIAASEARAKAEQAAEKSYGGVGNLQQLSDQALGRGRGISVVWGWLIAAAGVLIAAVTLLWKFSGK